MLIKALCDYYDKQIGSAALPEHLSEQKVHYRIFLEPDGSVSGIENIQREEIVQLSNGKTKKNMLPETIIMPKRSQKTAIVSNIAEHRPLYIFGLSYDKKKGEFTCDDSKAQKSHAAFVKENLQFCEGLNSDIVKAYLEFIKSWNPEQETGNSYLSDLAKSYEGSYFYFVLSGHPEIKLHEDSELLEKFRRSYSESRASTGEVIAECPIMGEKLPVARIHEKIKGIDGGNSVGGVLVGVNDTAFESYNKTQSYNSNISETAMLKYTTALNRLLADKTHKISADEMTIVYFAVKSDDTAECSLFARLLSGDPAKKLDSMLDTAMKEARQGRSAFFDMEGADRKATFYVVGLSPNSSRISQKFIVRDEFGRIADNIMQHQRDLQIGENARQIPLWAITKELVSPKSDGSQHVPQPLISAIFNAMLHGTRYPDMLLDTVIRRVKTDSDTEKSRFIKLNDTRAGIIKACLNRKARLSGKKEEITMSLDKENKNPAYLCGRLFAVLEYVQRESVEGELNRTIKDSYFASACSRPATVFPKLVKLAQNHLAKLDNERYWFMRIGDIIDGLENEFPSTLDNDDQGRFIIGYYQENKYIYTPKKKSEEN